MPVKRDQPPRPVTGTAPATMGGRALLRVGWRHALVSAVLVALGVGASPATAHFDSSQYTWNQCGSNHHRVDPVNVVFYGYGKSALYAAAHVQQHTGWSNTSGSSQVFYTHGNCRTMNEQRASACGTCDRNHLRFFQTYHAGDDGRDAIVADAHHELFVEGCLPGGHAVSPDEGNGSGFDIGRRRIYDHFKAHHYTKFVPWGNTQKLWQCRENWYARSNGYVIWVGL